MLKEQARTVAYWVWITDLALTAAAFMLAWALRSHLAPMLFPGLFPTELYPLSRYLGLLPFVLIIWTALLLSRETYSSRRVISLSAEAWQVLQIVVLGSLALATTGWALRLDFVSRPFLLLFAGLDLIFLLAEKLSLRLLAREVRARGYNYRNLLIVGLNNRAAEVARIIEEHPHWGLRLLGFVAPNGDAPGEFHGRRVLGRSEDLEKILEEQVVDEVFFILSRRQLDEFESAILLCSELGIRSRVALYFPHLKARVLMEDLEGIPLLTFTTTPASAFQLFLKSLLDFTLSALGLILLSPLMLLIALAIKLSSRGPVFFIQERCGLNGRRFRLYKFRTMVRDAEKKKAEIEHLNRVEGHAFKAPDDPRITPIGRILRRSSLDELPQLINILQGKMSLVGPRPPIPEEVEHYQRWQRRRLSMRPGLTGLWQVSGRAGIEDFNHWIRLDLQYIDQWSLWLDVRILLKTIPAVLSGKGAG